MKKNFYVISVFKCVEPELSRPYKSYRSMLRAARKVYVDQFEEDSIFWLCVGSDGKPVIGSFTNAELENSGGKNHCSYCGSGLFDEKRNCQKCGL